MPQRFSFNAFLLFQATCWSIRALSLRGTALKEQEWRLERQRKAEETGRSNGGK